MVPRITVVELNAHLARAERLSFEFTDASRTNTRAGIYIKTQTGLKSGLFFIGLARTGKEAERDVPYREVIVEIL